MVASNFTTHGYDLQTIYSILPQLRQVPGPSVPEISWGDALAPLRPIICPAIVLVAFMSGPALAVTQEQIKFIYDQRPDADIPREARMRGQSLIRIRRRIHSQTFHLELCIVNTLNKSLTMLRSPPKADAPPAQELQRKGQNWAGPATAGKHPPLFLKGGL